MTRILKNKLGIVVGFLVALAILNAYCALTLKPFPFPEEGALASETELVRVAMIVMMEDKNITTVTPNNDTSNSLGVNTWTNMPAGPDAASLYAYLSKATTKFYYCWDRKGNVYAQNEKDGVRAVPKDAEKQRPCKKSPRDSS